MKEVNHETQRQRAWIYNFMVPAQHATSRAKEKKVVHSRLVELAE
jgi:hypothetical protein